MANAINVQKHIPDDNTLVFTINHHISVAIISQSINMWWILIDCLGSSTRTQIIRINQDDFSEKKKPPPITVTATIY